MPQTKVRVVGSGFTTFNYRGKPIAFLTGFRDQGQQAIGEGGNIAGGAAEAITQIGSKHPDEIATSRVLGPGTFQMTIRELWNAPVWFQLTGLVGANDIVDVYQRLAAEPSAVTAQVIIKPPGAPTWRGKTYHNVTIFDIDDTETVTVGALSIARTLQAAYTHTSRFTIAASS